MVKKEMPMHHTERETWRLRQTSSPGSQSWWAAPRFCISISFDFFFTSWCWEWGVSSERPRACGRNAQDCIGWGLRPSAGLCLQSFVEPDHLGWGICSLCSHLLLSAKSRVVAPSDDPSQHWCYYVCACSVIFNPLWSHGMHHAKLLCPWDFPGKNTEVCCRFLLQRLFPTQGSNQHLLDLLHREAHSSPLHHLGSPLILLVSPNINKWISVGCALRSSFC